MNLYKKCITKLYSFFVIDATLASDNLLRFRKNLLEILPIALAQVKTGYTFENLLNENCQIIYSLYRAKKITKKGYNNIMNSIKL